MADRYWVGGSGNSWHATGPTNWSDVAGGTNDFSIPGPGDNVFFTSSNNTQMVLNIPVTVDNMTIGSGYTAGGLGLKLVELLRVTGTLTLNGNSGINFVDVGGFDVNNYLENGCCNKNVRFTSGTTFRIRDSFVSNKGASTNSDFGLYYSGLGGQTLFVVDDTAFCDTVINFFSIDASGGRTLNQLSNFAPSNCVNIIQFYLPDTYRSSNSSS
jgi:hypothetical protein